MPLILIFMKLDMDVNWLGTLIMEIIVLSTLGWVFNNIEAYNEETYTCPSYCGVDHEHIIWDLQSDFEELLAENAKLSKNIELAVK